MSDAICQDCREPKKIWSRNRCVTCYRAHLKALKAEGSYTPLIRKKPRLSPFDKVMSRVEKESVGGCWLYIGALASDGYARVKDAGSDLALLVHRVVYEQMVGSIPDGLVLDHLCRVRNCVNPKHLEPVTGAENIRRGFRARLGERTHCTEGHELTPENTAFQRRTTQSGVTMTPLCRTCKNAYDRARQKRLKEEKGQRRPPVSPEAA